MKNKRKSLIVAAGCACVWLVLAVSAAWAAPNIAGRWETQSGEIYTIAQMGEVFTWRMPDTGRNGAGSINDYTATAVWPFGSASGTIIVDAVDRGVRIDWNNGVVFTRVGESGEPAGDFSGDWALIGTQAREIYAGGSKLYGVMTGTGDLYEYSGSGDRWALIGSGGSSYAVDGNGYIYGISSGDVWRYNGTGTSWTRIGGPAVRLYAGGRNLFATAPETGDIYQYGGTPGEWTRVGSSGATFAVNDQGYLFGLSPSGVFAYNGDPDSWTQIGPAASDLFAGGNRLFATHTASGDVYRYNGSPNSWTRIGGSGVTFTVDGSGRIYGLSPTGVFRHDGTGETWTQIGGPGIDIDAGTAALYGLTADGNVWRYSP